MEKIKLEIELSNEDHAILNHVAKKHQTKLEEILIQELERACNACINFLKFRTP